MITQKHLKLILHYDNETGDFKWKKRVSINVTIGGIAGTLKSICYRRIGINGKSYLAHRLAWLYCYGEFPDGQIDHINRIKTDNRISNLRIATKSQNNSNMTMNKLNKSGYKGVCWNKVNKKWESRISLNGKRESLGSFNCKKEAYNAYCKRGKEFFGDFFCG